MQTIEGYLPGTISTGIVSMCMFRHNCQSTSKFPFVISDTFVATYMTAFSEGNGNWLVDVEVSQDSGVTWVSTETFNINAGSPVVGDFVGLVLPKCSLVRLKYRSNTGNVVNPQISFTLSRLN